MYMHIIKVLGLATWVADIGFLQRCIHYLFPYQTSVLKKSVQPLLRDNYGVYKVGILTGHFHFRMSEDEVVTHADTFNC